MMNVTHEAKLNAAKLLGVAKQQSISRGLMLIALSIFLLAISGGMYFGQLKSRHPEWLMAGIALSIAYLVIRQLWGFRQTAKLHEILDSETEGSK